MNIMTRRDSAMTCPRDGENQESLSDAATGPCCSSTSAAGRRHKPIDSSSPDQPSRAMLDEETAAQEEEPGRSRLFLAVVAVAVFISTLTGSMVNVMIPLMRAEFAASAAEAGWIITGFALAYAVTVPLYGRMSDLFGVRRVFCLGLLGFAAGNLICALAPSLSVLIAGRVVQATGGAVVPALASVAVAKVLAPGKRGGALGIVASSVGIGSTVGPIVGGLVGQLVGWRFLFLAVLLLTLFLLVGAFRVLPNTTTGQGQRSIDLAGGILLGVAAGVFLFGITRAQAAGLASLSSWGSFLVATLAALGFIRRIHATAQPFVSPLLFRNRTYVAALLVAFFTMLAYLSVLVVVPLLLVEVNGLEPGAAGLALAPGAAALALLSPLTGRLSDRYGVRPFIIAGLLILALAVFFISTFAGASPLLIALGVLGLGSGFACIQSPANNAAANSLSEQELGGGMGIFSAAFFLGAGTGTALVGAWLAERQETGAGALNPLYAFEAAPFSDAFLAVIAALVVALIAAFRIRGSAQGSRSGGAG